jgi:hypothetical protein
LTPHATKDRDCAPPEVLGGGGAPEIAITAEMLSAGVEAYYGFDLKFGEVEDRVSSVYRAMVTAKRK